MKKVANQNNKRENTFRFQSFSERISKIDVNVFHHVPHKYEEDSGENRSYLYEAVAKWNDLNKTQNWLAFKQEIGNNIETLPQLLNQKEKIIQVFLNHIKIQNELSMQPVLESLIAFVKDLRHEIYPYYPQLLCELIKVLKSKDPDMIEAAFTCLAYIFKYLVKDLVKDLDKVLLDLAPLLHEKNPTYIRNFATQSFAFVARRVKNKRMFLLVILKIVKSSPQLLQGCGQLLFETMRGIRGFSHSFADEMLYVLFNEMGNSSVPQKSLLHLSCYVIQGYTAHISPAHSILIKTMITALEEKLNKIDNPANEKGIKQILRTIRLAVKSQSGAHVQDQKSLVDVIIMVIDKQSSFKKVNVQKIIADICIIVLKSGKIRLSQDVATKLVIKVMNMNDADIKLRFFDQTSSYGAFETLILPRALSFFSEHQHHNFLPTLTKIVVNKTSKNRNSETLERYGSLKTDSSNEHLFNLIIKNLSDYVEKRTDNSRNLMCSLILIRHFETNDKTVVETITKVAKTLLSEIEDHEDKKKKLIFALCICLETLLYFSEDYCTSEERIPARLLISVLSSTVHSEKSVVALRILDVFLTLDDRLTLEEQELAELNEIAEEWLMQPQSNGRYLALHILLLLEKLKSDNCDKEMVNLLESCINCEKIPLTITDYREKLRILENLKCEFLHIHQDKFKIPLKYLLGLLYCNFKLLWDPIFKIIATYSTDMPKEMFWDTFLYQLHKVTTMCKENTAKKASLSNIDYYFVNSVRLVESKDREDHSNYRLLLWQLMNFFPGICETNNRDVVNLYLDFIRDELRIKNMKTEPASTLNIKIHDNKGKTVADLDGDEDDDDEVVDNQVGSKTKNVNSNKGNSVKKAPEQVLSNWAVAQLNLLSKFQNPKCCYREAEVRESYFDLLLHKNNNIQKSALKCLLSYKFDYMLRYESHLRRLINDTSFRSALRHFRVDKENEVLLDLHRDLLMPIVMRIVYAKMLSRAPVKRGNKTTASRVNRTAVMRFLAGCRHSEMQIFFQLAFGRCNIDCKGDSASLVDLMNSVNLEKVTKPKKLKNAVDLIENIFKDFGAFMSNELQRYLLIKLLGVGAVVAGVFKKRDHVFRGYINTFRQLRISVLNCLTKIFERFQRFPWSEDEIESVFQICVWPYLKNLPIEGIHSPTALLKLFSVWSNFPRYFLLLARYNKKDMKMTPLPFVISLLLKEQSTKRVITYIEQILENLLTLDEKDDEEEDEGDEKKEKRDEDKDAEGKNQDKINEKINDNENYKKKEGNEDKVMDVDEEPVPLVNISYILKVDEAAIAKLNLTDKLNYGSQILIPHVGSIVNHLLRQLRRSKGRSLSQMEITILSRITELATSFGHEDSLLSLLFRLLISKRGVSEESLVDMLNTVKNLMNVVKKPMKYVRYLAELLGKVESLPARETLLNILKCLENRHSDLKDSVQLIRDLNAFHAKRIGQPDFDKRLDAFQQVKELSEKGILDVGVAFVVLQNCFYMIRHETDLSLRDCALDCLRHLCPTVAKSIQRPRSKLKAWLDTILRSIQANIVSDNEVLQNACVLLLGTMARECRDLHPVLEDLAPLVNKEDPEGDFFENSVHLQSFRRMKALLKFIHVAKSLTKAPNPHTLTKFILPLAQQYLCCDKYSGKNTLIDAAIGCIGTVCRLLPWDNYQRTLSHYLKLLRTEVDYQKQLVRIVIVILDAFHFDLRQHLTADEQNDGDEECNEKIEEDTKTLSRSETKDNESNLDKNDEVEGGEKENEEMEVDDEEEGNDEEEECDYEDIKHERQEIEDEEADDEENQIEDDNEEGEEEEDEDDEIDENVEGQEGVEEEEEEEDGEDNDDDDDDEETENQINDDEGAEVDKEKKEEDENMSDDEDEEEGTNDEDAQSEISEDEAPDENELNEDEGIEEDVEGDDEKESKPEEPMEEDDNEDKPKKILAIEAITVLDEFDAERVHGVITNSLIHQLNKAIGQRSKREETHKLNHKSLGPDEADEEIRKIPIAIAVVKLLQKVSDELLENHLPRIFMKLCTFLKSRMESIRRAARDTIKEIVICIGPKCLPKILFELSTSLSKGFQLHVLVVTIYGIILCISEKLRPGDIDANLSVLLEVCKTDLFGLTSEEKEVAQIQSKVQEARSGKSLPLLRLMAQYISDKCLTDLILPFKEVLETTHSHKIVTKCRACLHHVVLGLTENKLVSCESLIIFVYGVVSESIPQLSPTVPEFPKKHNPKEKTDCFLVPPPPKTQYGEAYDPVKRNVRTNAHVIVEFGLQLLLFLIKREKIRYLDKSSNSFLDPLVPVISKTLQSQQVRVNTLSLKCLIRLLKYDLPNLKNEIESITDYLFTILHKFGAAGLSKGDNFDLVVAAFKTISTIIRVVDYYDLKADQYKILLLYTEQDMHDTSRQAAAFTMLKTILMKKVNVPELAALMDKVTNLSITSQLNHVRVQSRDAVLRYVMDYPLGKKLEEIIVFYISQLSYAVESGRASALQMLHSFVIKFPSVLLERHCPVILLTVGARLVNEDSSECKKMVSVVIKTLVKRLDPKSRDKLFDILVVWLSQKKLNHRRLAAQIVGFFVTEEESEFSKRLPQVLPLIHKQFVNDRKPGSIVRVPKDDPAEDQLRDHHYFQVLQLLLKLCVKCPEFLTDTKYQEYLNSLTEISQSLLCYPHEWVRLSATQFLGYIFTSIPPEEVAAALNGLPTCTKSFFLESTSIHRRVRSLILDHCSQFMPGIGINEQFLDQATKNLVYFARVLKDVKNEETEEGNEVNVDEGDDEGKNRISLLWLVRRMRRIINAEISRSNSSYLLRSAVFKWIGAITVCLSKKEMLEILYHVVAPIVRETEFLESKSGETNLKTLIREVSVLIKRKVGMDVYAKEAVKAQAKLSERRTKRKSAQAQEFVTDPEKAVKRKLERKEKKKEAKKRKIAAKRGKPSRNVRRKSRNDNDEFI